MSTATVQGYSHPVIEAYLDRAGRVYDVNSTTCAKCHASNGQVNPPRRSFFDDKPIIPPTMVAVAFHRPYVGGICGDVLRVTVDHMHLTCQRCGYQWWRRPKDAELDEERRYGYALDARWPHMRFGLPPPVDHKFETCEMCQEAERRAERAEAELVAWIEAQS